MIYNGGKYNDEWDTKILEELGTFSRGISKHRPRNDQRLFKNGKYPLIQTGEIKAANVFVSKHTQTYNDFGLQQSKMWDAGTLCITIAANIAETAILDYPMCFPDSVVGFQAYQNETSELFMHYLFEYIRNSIQNAASGSIQDNINLEYLMSLKFKIPKKEYQDKLVNVLSSLDKKINLNNKINNNLQQQLKLIYDYWFNQYDFPDENGKPYRSTGGAMELNKKVGRQIPNGWKVGTVTNNPLTEIIKPGVDRFETKTYLATADVNATAVSVGNIVEYETRESRANMQPSENSVWFAKMKNSIKHLYLNREMGPLIQSSILSTGFCGLQCKEIGFEYIASFIEHSHFENLKDKLAHGATQEAVNNDDLSNIAIVVPSEDILHHYHNITRGIYSMISRNICENQELARLRYWLLPILMNGQATISD